MRQLGENWLEAAEWTGRPGESLPAQRTQVLRVAPRTSWGQAACPVTFPHIEPGLILTSDDKDPNNGNLFGEHQGAQNRS